jgi:tRNA A37 N6-isopentenylltransferase MiaA
MSDNKTAPSDLDLLIASINDLAREIGEMEPDDPVRAVRLKELYTLTELSTSLKTEGNKTTDKRIDTVRR